jgi:hypothetical protein
MLTSPKATGVCQLIAVGKNIEDAPDGRAVKLKAAEIAKQISASYGPWTSVTDQRSDGKNKTDNSRDWVAELKANKRKHEYSWDKNKFDPKNDVERIVVQARATDANNASVGVIFYFSNFDRCTDALKKLTTGSDAF